jgi:parallel beta-helix repeat protein
MMNVIDPHHNTFIRLFAAFLFASTLSWIPGIAQVPISGVISQNTTLTKNNNPYIVVEDVIVSEGVTLTIEPGTIIEFQPFRKLTVQGTLIAHGTKQDSIFFIVFNKPNNSPWLGLVFDNSQTSVDSSGNYISGTVLSNASISDASNAITLKGKSGILIENSLIQKCDDGIYLNDAENTIIRECRISQTGLGIFISSGSTAWYNRIENNVISDNYLYGFLINNCNSKVQHNQFIHNRVEKNYIGVYIGNEGFPDIGNNSICNNIISNNIFEGARIQQDSTVFLGNFVNNNHIGLTLKLTEGSLVSRNVFSNNESYAIQITDSASNNRILQNNISRNGGGIFLSSESDKQALFNTFLNNTIYLNHGTSFLIESSPQGPIHYNNFYLNGDTNSFVNRTVHLIEAENNWWGTESTALIDSMIYDVLDDPLLGLVRYQQSLGQTDTIAPIMPPRNVVKKQAGGDVLVSWDPVMAADLAGYYVYFGNFNGYTFTYKVIAGNVTSLILPSHSVFDSIAVSAFDFGSDGMDDQVEGHESEYVFASLSPYAGPDTTICINSPVSLDKATAFNYEFIKWTSSGDGSFSGSHVLKTIYNPGTLDYQNGQVTLTLNISGAGFNLLDQVIIKFSEPPMAFAGNDSFVLSDSIYTTSYAISDNQGGIKWETSGDGTFDNDSILVTSYKPGLLDISNGSFILTLHSSSSCGSASDEVVLTVLPSYSVKGRVHAGNQLAGGSRLQLFSVKEDIVSEERSNITTSDGVFSINHLISGDYYIYVIPDEIAFGEFAPTYYCDRLHWNDAYKLAVAENTYDIDINLQKISMILPPGEGVIGGHCMATGSAGSQCGDIIVLLYDKTAKYLLGWVQLDETGAFHFADLPFGDYQLVGEKAGYKRLFSQVISLTPEHPEVTDAQLHIEPFKISFFIPSAYPGLNGRIRAFPMPVKDFVYFENIPAPGLYTITITSSDGKNNTSSVICKSGEPAMMDFSSIPTGLYLLRLYSGDVFLQTIKIIKL